MRACKYSFFQFYHANKHQVEQGNLLPYLIEKKHQYE